MVDDLLLEQGSPNLGEGLGFFLVEFPHLAFLAGILADPLDERLGDLVVGDLDIGLLADLCRTSPSRTRRSAILR